MNFNLKEYLSLVASGFRAHRAKSSCPNEAGFLDGGIDAINGYLAYLAARDTPVSTAAKPPLAETFDHEEIEKIVDDDEQTVIASLFEPGDVVYLRSGGAAMTVERVKTPIGGDAEIYCVWLDSTYKCQRRLFTEDVLMLKREVL